jgi:tRNA (adenine22-N1)-methyltransferase
MLQEEGFLIIEESMVKEDEKYYFIMKAIKNSLNLDAKKYVLKEKEHFYYGKLLLEQKNNILKEFILWDYSLCEGIMESLNAEQTENSLARKQEIKERMDLLQRGLAYY